MADMMADGSAEQGVLRGVKIIDLSQGLAGAVCTLLLAEAGAEVVLIEPPGGDARRGTPQFAVWNRSKTSVAIDWRADERGVLDQLLAGADILVHDLLPSDARRLGMDPETLAVTMPALSVCTIGGYPLGHPEEEMPLDDFLVLASAGLLDEQPAARREGPVYLPFALGSWGAAWLATVGAAARLYAQRKGGRAGSVATSILQGGLAHTMAHWRMAETPTPSLAAGWPKRFRNSVFECADGVWLHVMAAPDNVPLMRQELDRMGDQTVTRLNHAMGFVHPLFPNLGANIQAFRAHPGQLWLNALWSSDVAVQPVLRLGDAYADEQARSMQYVVEVKDPAFGVTLQPASPIGVTPPMRLRSSAPASAGEAPVWKARQGQRQKPTASGKPLAGLRVLDFGQHLAGPWAPMLMADLGAEVIKIESLQGDAMRPFEWAFVGCQRGKRALACNLKDPAARDIIATLVRGADVVVHNLRLPAAERLGIDYPAFSAINPKLIYAHCSAYGPRGPRRNWPGYDQLFQALSGWEDACRGEGNPPDWLRFGMMDHQCAYAAAYGTLLALIERETTGRGQIVTASILGASLLTTAGAVLVTPVGVCNSLPPLDSLQTGVESGRRLYRCSDGWVALVAGADALDRLGVPLEPRLAALTVKDVLSLARTAGACAVEARTEAASVFLTDPRNIELGTVASYPHRHYGMLTQPGAFLSFDGIAMVSASAPPILGQDSRAILREAGFDGAIVDRFVNEGIIAQASG
ncbi:MAG: putative acyl-CoA transferase/carnitine dehydratase [Gammaproteobacteria bacterium]|jgi:crotonobetainyl-CoA:carnitine CoA-transferase CaiB-like acyl-CoA transferase|nr:putative acyl-CoA transferase/carnitine dehydratase [Gammaproteobacteria bacterium]